MSIEEQLAEIQRHFSMIPVAVEKEGGSRFLRLPQFFTDPEDKKSKIDCLFGCDNHLGYETRLWFSKIVKTSEQRNWNHANTYILGHTWNAFSFKAKGDTLLEKLLSHLAGAK